MLYADTALNGDAARHALRARLLRHGALPVCHRRAVRLRRGQGLIAGTIAAVEALDIGRGERAADFLRQRARAAQARSRRGRDEDAQHHGEAARRRDGRLSRRSRPHAGRRDHRHHGDLGRQRHHAPSRARIRRGGVRLPGAGPVLAAGAGRRAVRPQSRACRKRRSISITTSITTSACATWRTRAPISRQLPECNGKVGAVGYCLGGKLCYLMCCRTDIDCAVAYYGTYIEHNIREAPNLHRPFVLHMAMKDRWVQAEVNELLERRLSPNPLVDDPQISRRRSRLRASWAARPTASRRPTARWRSRSTSSTSTCAEISFSRRGSCAAARAPGRDARSPRRAWPWLSIPGARRGCSR